MDMIRHYANRCLAVASAATKAIASLRIVSAGYAIILGGHLASKLCSATMPQNSVNNVFKRFITNVFRFEI